MMAFSLVRYYRTKQNKTEQIRKYKTLVHCTLS